MVRIGRALIIGLVTRIAICRDCRVVVVYVAARTSHCRVLAGEGEGRIVVVERRGYPRGRVMTHLTLLGESRLNVIGICRAVEIF